MMMDVVAAGLDELHERVAGRFARAEPRARVREYVSGLVTGLERKNGWTLAEWAGEVSPDGMQRLLRRADWDVDGVRDDVRAYVAEQLGEPGGVLIADDTGFLKKGTRSAGVQRQYSGTAGRTENCQVGVFLAYASEYGHALIDRELYLPQSWMEDPQRCRAAGIPEEAEFTTRPRQAQAMIARAVAAGVPFSWFTADEACGQAKWLQAWLEDQDIWYVMAIRCSDTLTTPEGERRAGDLIAAVPARAWQKISAGAGAHGPREYHWARIPVRAGWERGRGHWLLARRPLAGPAEIACYSTRSAPGGPGMPTSPCPCSPWPGWLPAGPRPKKRDRHQRPRHDRLHPARDPPPADQLDPGQRTRPRGRLVLVPVAPTTPVPGPAMPLPATRLCAHLSAVAVLSVRTAQTGTVEK